MYYNEDAKYTNWSDLSAEEKEDIYNRNKLALKEIERYLETVLRAQGRLTYGDFYEAAGLWDKSAREDPLRRKYYDWPYIL